jgi:DNA-binding transcriptional regulator YhcF (GntR family)
VSLPKFMQVAAIIRAQIADGILRPGESAPSAAALSRVTGYSALTCRKALNALINDGVLVAGASPGARPRVPACAAAPGEQTLASAARALSEALAGRRRAAGLTQPQLAEMVGMSVTTVGHAETGRLWQGRRFWERADKELSAGGALLALHDVYRAVSVPSDPASCVEEPATEDVTKSPETVAVAASGPVASVTITWADGTVTTVYPPGAPVRSAGTTPASWPRGLPGTPEFFSRSGFCT